MEIFKYYCRYEWERSESSLFFFALPLFNRKVRGPFSPGFSFFPIIRSLSGRSHWVERTFGQGYIWRMYHGSYSTFNTKYEFISILFRSITCRISTSFSTKRCTNIYVLSSFIFYDYKKITKFWTSLGFIEQNGLRFGKDWNIF